MNLWISSQNDERLFKISNGLDVFQNGKNLFEWNVEDTLLKGLVFGTYKTKERAKEVLKEIKSIIENHQEQIYEGQPSSNYYYRTNIDIVYQMPKE